MTPIAKALRLWHTVRWLKPVQVYGRVWFRLSRPKPDLRPAPRVRVMSGAWVRPACREQSLLSATQMRFLEVERDLDAHGWDDPTLAKLWRYNQHYFDDLVALGSESRTAWHRALVARWIAECPPGRGTAWEPYPTSLRIVNWIKWIRAGNEPVPGMLDSLAAQVRFLTGRLEWHLLGNHLFVNAKALVIAGQFFEGAEADGWRERGWRILRTQILEQILSDGGQFERSPMYHALAVEDMLDLVNAMRAYPRVSADTDERLVDDRIGAMRTFLCAVCHPDGEVAFFNDSAQGVAPVMSELDGYATRLGLRLGLPVHARDHARDLGHARGHAGSELGLPVHARALPESGFIRVDLADCSAILDVGPVGPDYLPGHAHADTLSFELSIGRRRVLVNSGTSQYGLGPERLRQRGTAAHNTVVVDGHDSSEVWGGFRVARRARVTEASVDPSADGVTIRCAHDGYRRLPGGGDHIRTWVFASGRVTVTDSATPWAKSESHWHFAPGFTLTVADGGSALVVTDGSLSLRFSAEDAEWRVDRSTYSPRFGVSIPNWKAVARFTGPSPTVRIEWQPCTSSS